MESNQCQNGYEQVALRAASLAADGMHPAKAWHTAACEVFQNKIASIEKACPKSAFLGLAEAGHLLGVAPGRYTKSEDNKRYAETALELLRKNMPILPTPSIMWKQVMAGETKAHNSQMNVVLALWKANKFVGQTN